MIESFITSCYTIFLFFLFVVSDPCDKHCWGCGIRAATHNKTLIPSIFKKNQNGIQQQQQNNRPPKNVVNLYPPSLLNWDHTLHHTKRTCHMDTWTFWILHRLLFCKIGYIFKRKKEEQHSYWYCAGGSIYLWLWSILLLYTVYLLV